VGLFDFEEAEREILESGRRVVRGDTVSNLLDHRWLGMAFFLFVIGAIIHNTTLMALTGFMVVVVGVAWAWSRSTLQNVVYRRWFPHRRMFPGEELEAQVVVENRKPLPVGWLQIEDEWPYPVGPVDEGRLDPSPGPDVGFLTNTYTLRWYQRVRRRVTVLARHRGIYDVGPAYALSGDPFNLFERGHDLAYADYLIVYPEIKPLEALGLPMKDPLGDVSSRQRLFEDPNRIMGVRDHRLEDDLRHIHWKATARAGELQTRVYEPTRSVNLVLCLNVATYGEHWHGFWPAMLEYLVSTTASLAYWGVGQNYAVGLTANGTLAHADQPFRVLPGRSRDQLMRILETLAGVSYIVTADFGAFLLEESPHLPWGATLVLVTAFVDDKIEAMLLRLRDSGRQLVLFMLGKEAPPDLPGIVVQHLPIASEPPPPPDDDAMEEELTPRERFLRERARKGASS
jgi:uncharacterized protein (DUF58 family)